VGSQTVEEPILSSFSTSPDREPFLDWERMIEHRKSSVRCKVEHAFRIIKCQFGYQKTRYRGLKKNKNRLYAMFACANLYALALAGRSLRET